MSLVNDDYKQLQPTLNYLSDPIVLAQAWKKSHSYIRSHNWYADTLELDASTIYLEENLAVWGRELAAQAYRPKPMRLVPAPKTDTWTFEIRNKKWEWLPAKTQAKSSAKRTRAKLSEPLRPLAHLTIKDQTIATAMMMCMADAIETAQGATTNEKKVSSFGNRLFCSWNGDHAHFGWGNSTTYSKYFQDYQRFLKRTAGSVNNLEVFQTQFSTSPRAIYEMQLDMSAFYDSIDRKTLLAKLRGIVDHHHGLEKEETDSFWKAVGQCFYGWKWNAQDSKLNSCLKLKLANNGLPQGLVASGFFANAYLIDFDTSSQSMIGRPFDQFIIHDYCRYVDDLRFIISIDDGVDDNALDAIKNKIVRILGELLPEGSLKFNPEKTKLIKLSGEEGDVSSQMRSLQALTSGPMDLDSLINVENSLDSLFFRVETAKDAGEKSQQAVCPHPLATVHKTDLDVREDTVLRFAANRWIKVLQARRRLADHNALLALDKTQEAVARRFIASWAKNPALILLLKKGIQLFPSPILLSTVWEPLIEKLSARTPLRERCIASYCLAEIFRFSVTDLRRVGKADIPPEADIRGYYTYLNNQVRSLIQRPNLPWYLKQQAGLFIVSQKNFDDARAFKWDKMLTLVMEIATGTAIGKPNLVIPAALVAWQMTEDTLPIVSSLSIWLESFSTTNRLSALTTIAINSPDLYIELANHTERSTSKLNTEINSVSKSLGLLPPSLPDDVADWHDTYSLATVIQSSKNPFIHENALIKLALSVIDFLSTGARGPLSPLSLTISCSNWKSIQNPGAAPLSVNESNSHPELSADPRYSSPSWISLDGDGSALYGLGCLLRACAVGSCDFTATRTLFRQDLSDTYMGLKSSWYKRRMGMMHSPEALVGEAAPMSGWITELLFNLLQWPGLDTENWEEQWPRELSLTTLKPILKQRLDHQLRLYGVASDIPLYVHKIRPPKEIGRFIRVMTIQTLLPKRDDFKNHGTDLNRTAYREKHRGHLADICSLALKKLEAMDFANDRAVNAMANLIVFPELSVHQEDVDLLQALSAKTKAMVFAGIVFHEHEGKLINRALWLIPYYTGHGGLRWIKRWQGKWNMTRLEDGTITPWRPYQLLIELDGTLPHLERGYRLSGAICYDATDMRLTADLRDHSDAFLISALNSDIATFDNMIDALHYHMYQHVILVNTGEFGGSAAKAPFKLPHHRQITHTHGSDQISISVFEIDMMSLMGEELLKAPEDYTRTRKTKPAGIRREGIP